MMVRARPGVKGMATQTWREVPGLRDYLADRNPAHRPSGLELCE